VQYINYYAGEAGSKETMPAKPAVEPIVEQPPLSRRHDSKLSLSQHRAYLLAVDALGVLDVRQPCAGHYVVEATYVATERIEESTSHEVSPNVDEVLASGVSSSKLADTNDAHGCFGRRVRGVHYACHGYRRRSPGPRRFFSTGAQGPALFY